MKPETEPRHSRPPDLVMMLTIPPCAWPYCGSKPPVFTCTSSMNAVLMPTPSVP